MASLLEALFAAILSWWAKRKAAANVETANDHQAEANADVARESDTTEQRLEDSRARSAGDVSAVTAAGGGAPADVLRQRAIVNEAIDRANSGGDL
jgi:hypothetical protein